MIFGGGDKIIFYRVGLSSKSDSKRLNIGFLGPSSVYLFLVWT